MRLYDLTRLEEAVEAQGDAIAMLRRQMREANQEDLIHSLATALVNQALALMGLGDSDGGMAAFEAAIAAAQSAVDDGERHELGNVLVMALTYKGSALAQVGHLPEGLATLDTAVATSQRLLDHGWDEPRDDLARPGGEGHGTSAASERLVG